MKRIICILALALVFTLGLGPTTKSTVSPTGTLPGLMDPGEDHPWGGNEFGPHPGSFSSRAARIPGSTGNFVVDFFYRHLLWPLLDNTIKVRYEIHHAHPSHQPHGGTTVTTTPTQGSN